jgi:hypothetical protein
MVPSGSVLTYQAQCTTDGSFQTPNDVLTQVNQTCSQSGISLRDSNVTAGILDTILSPVNGALDFQLTLTVQTSSDFNAVSDIQGIIDHGVYLATNAMPISSIPNVTVPGGASTPTGQPGQTAATNPAKVHVCGDPSWGFLDDPAQYFKCLTQGAATGFSLLMIGVILAVVLIIAGKHKGMSVPGL